MATTDPRNRVALENDGSRVDARAKVTGAAKYTHDIKLPEMMFARHIRAPFSNAKLVKADLDAAKKIKGVIEVNLEPEGRGDYAGQSVGYVCAESPRLIKDAMKALNMEWSNETPAVDGHALKGELPALEKKKPDDVDQAELDQVLGQAKHVIEANYETQIQHHVSLETHSSVVQVADGKIKAWGSTQGTFAFRDGLAKDSKIDKANIEVNVNYVGGGFGSKLMAGIEGTLAAQLAGKYNRPCKVVYTRKDESLDTGMRPGTIQYYKLAADESGKILGGRFYSWGLSGVKNTGGGGVKSATYNLGKFAKGGAEISLSQCPARPQRAPGWPQGQFAMESALDELAKACGLDPIAFRKINDPKTDRHKQYDTAMKEIGWDRRKPDGQWPGVVKHGFGCGAIEWENQMFFGAGAEVRIYHDGKVDIRSGAQDIGTGTRTLIVDLTAHTLGVPREMVTGLLGSAEYPTAPFSGGSMVSRSIAPPIIQAAEQAKTQVLELAAKELNVPADQLDVKAGAIVAKADGAKKMEWAAACKLITQDFLQSVVTKADVKYRGKGDSDGVALAEVAVDTETGVVRVLKVVIVQQCGIVVNRKTAESQIAGSAIQGVGFALFEERIMNAVNGAHVNPNMEWYKLPGPVDIPEIVPILDVPEDATGVRSLGEPTLVGVPAAIANAVANATGARVRSLPLTPAKVMAAMSEKGAKA